MRITAELLRELELKGKWPCKRQVLIFEEKWPQGLEVTVESIIQAYDLYLDIEWFAEAFLTSKAWKTYIRAANKAWAIYLMVTEPSSVSPKTRDAACETYKRVIAETLLEAVENNDG